jgi:hypothetical protein
MPRYLISFDEGAMVVSEEELPAVRKASYAVVEEARAAGAWVFGGGVLNDTAGVVGTDGTVTAPAPATGQRLGGFCIVEVPNRDEAEAWAAKFAVACRCPQLVRELMTDPDA